MPLTTLDTDQKEAAVLTSPQVAVSAGAGSGKTRLLVGRYLHLAGTLGVPPEHIVAITFTEKAANHMKAAIAEGARALAAANPERAVFWREVANAVHGAPISTIHAFCNGILRRYPVEAGVDPLFAIIDDTARSELAREILDDFLAGWLDGAPGEVQYLLELLGMRDLRALLRSFMDQRCRITKGLDTIRDLGADEFERRYRDALTARAAARIAMLREFHSLGPAEDKLTDSLNDLLERLVDLHRALMADKDNVSVRTTVLGCREIVKSIGHCGSTAKWAASGTSIAGVRRDVRESIDVLLDAVEAFGRERGITARAAVIIRDAWLRLEEAFLAAKKARSVLDHDDTLVETWRLLRSHTAVCREVAAACRHILVDEFQDTDKIQADIFDMIAGNSDNSLFTVGDPKQSIYRFRGADVTVFDDFIVNAEFRPLKKNYRSAEGIVGFVNRAFSRIMGTDRGVNPFEAVYSDMKPERTGTGGPPPVEILVIEGENTAERRRAEAAAIAARVRALHDNGEYAYGDMALLTRTSTRLRDYEEALLDAGVPYVNLSGGDPFSRPEARDIASLLSWMAEPEDPAHLCALLLSPFCGVTPETLHGLVRASGSVEELARRFVRDGIPAGHPWCDGRDVESVRNLLADLLALRDLADIRTALETAFDRTGYTLALLADPLAGELSLAVTDHIMERADAFEAAGGTLPEFARLLRTGGLHTDRMPAVEVRGDVLTVLTIHKAKGLEFPVVFLADISGGTAKTPPPFVLDPDLGFGFTLRDSGGNSMPTLVRILADERRKQEEIAESKRVFYVGCTRAADRLFISGGPPGRDTLFERDDWMGWLHTALGLADGTCPPAVTYRIIEAKAVATAGIDGFWAPVLDPARRPVESPAKPLIAEVAAAVAADPVPPADLPPDHLSPTMIASRLRDGSPGRRSILTDAETADIAEYEPGLGVVYGLLAHRVLERWDFADPERSLRLVDTFAGPETSPELMDRLKRDLRRFAASLLHGRIARAESVRREEPFAVLVDGILVRGAIDCLFRENGAWHIVDYKTDAVDGGDFAAAAEPYFPQLAVYALALRRAEYEPPGSLAIHFLSADHTHEFPVSDRLADDAERLVRTVAAGY